MQDLRADTLRTKLESRWNPLALGIGLGAILLVTGGCVSLGTATQPEGFQCDLDPRLAGTWTSGLEMSQLGPAGMRIRIDCDCSYRVKARVFLFMTIRERGPVWSEPARDEAAEPGESAADGVMIFRRATGDETPWPYRFENGELLLEESPGEWTAMRRKKPHRCPTHPSP